MEYTNQENFNIWYENEANSKTKKGNFLKNHKIMSLVIASTIVLIGVNGFMIFNFFSILSTI